MKTTLALALLLAGCQTAKPPTDERSLAVLVAPPVRPDSAHTNATQIPQTAAIKTVSDKRNEKETAPAPRKGILSFLSSRNQPKETAANATQMPRKCKGCTFYYGPATVTTIGKKAGPSVVASDAVRQNTAGANTQQTATDGTGNQVSARKQDTTQQAKGWAAGLVDNLTSWIPWAILALLALAVVFRKRLPLVGPFFA